MKGISRRGFVAAVGAAGAAGLATRAVAQQGGGEGIEYRSVKPTAPVDAPAGKVEVIEFFWYGCPHCNALEPAVKEWSKRLAPDVAFRKVHVPWQVQAHQQLYYTLETMGRADALDEQVFAAIHRDRNRLDTPEAMADLLAKHGVDRKQFTDTYQSFAVRTRMRKASAVAEAYGLDGVPAFGVNGKWFTSPSMAGGNAQALRVLEQLIERERKGAR